MSSVAVVGLRGQRVSPVGRTAALRRLCQRKSGREAIVVAASVEGKTVVITGGNTGIGYETAKSLAGKGMGVIIACRDEAKAKAAVASLRETKPSGTIESLILDLADLSSVKDFSSAYLDSGRSLDVLINNAGVMACPQMETKDGFELQLGVNHIAHFALTTQLLPLLEKPESPSRIINVSSSAHTFGTMNFDDLMGSKNYQPWVAYGQSKLANVLFTYELARRLGKDANCTVNALHPGVVDTELSRYLIPDEPPFWQKPFVKVMKMLIKTPAQGAETSIYLASSDSVEGITAKYWSDCVTTSSSGESYDRKIASKLWQISEELVSSKVAV